MNRTVRKILVWIVGIAIVGLLGLTVHRTIQFDKGSSENYALTNQNKKLKDGIVVFCYHRVLKNTPGVDLSKILSNNSQLHDFNVPLDQFDKQMKFLRDHHIKVLSAEQMALMIRNHIPIHGKYAVLTFDDIDRTTIDNALPVMKKYHMPFTTFIITGNTGRYREGTQLATWSQIKAAKRSAGDLMTLGLHTNAMHYLNAKFQPIFTEKREFNRFTRDFATSKQVMKREMGIESKVFAYPYGSGTDQTNDFLAKQHLDMVATLSVGIATNDTDLNQTPRMIINENSWPSISHWYEKSDPA